MSKRKTEIKDEKQTKTRKEELGTRKHLNRIKKLRTRKEV